MCETFNDSQVIMTYIIDTATGIKRIEPYDPHGKMKFEPLLEVPRYEFVPLLPEVRDKIKAWRRQDAKASKSK